MLNMKFCETLEVWKFGQENRIRSALPMMGLA